MAQQTAVNLHDIRAFQAQNPKLRACDASDALCIPVAQLVAASVGSDATRIASHPHGLIPAAEKLGEVMTLTRVAAFLSFGGRVTLNGQDIDAMKPWELAAQRAVLPQTSRLAFPFTAIEGVRLGLQADTSENKPGVPMQAVAWIGLAHYADRTFQELSGGEAQRVMLARVLTQVWTATEGGQPRWLLLDEPVASLDIAHPLMVMQNARGFARARGGVIAFMHDLNLTALFADNVAVLAEGARLAFGTPSKVLTDETLSRAYGCDFRVSAPSYPGNTVHPAARGNSMTGILMRLAILYLAFAAPAIARPAAEIVILGEVHDNADAHPGQAAALRGLRPSAAIFEMLTDEQAPARITISRKSAKHSSSKRIASPSQ